MNRRGFTLIELLAVLVALGIIFTISAPSMMNVFRQSKLKSEEIFVKRLSQAIDSYVSLYKEKMTFTKIDNKTFQKTEKQVDELSDVGAYDVDVYEGDTYINEIIRTKILTNKDYINAGNKEIACSTNAKVEVYRDSDFVYCFKINKNDLGCLTEEYKNSITGDYAIDTCVWEEKK